MCNVIYIYIYINIYIYIYVSLLGAGRQEVIAFGGRQHEVIGFGDPWGPSGDHLGNRFDEVIDF